MRRILVRQGEDVSFTHGTGLPATVRGMFFLPYEAGELGRLGVTGTNPHFAAMSSDLPSVAVNDTIVRAAVTYRVKTKKPDDPSGITVLELKR